MVANVAAGLVHVREYLRFRYDRWETVRSHYRKWPRSCGDTSDITRSARLRARATAVNHKCETSVARCGYGENRPARQGSREIALMALSVIGAPVLGEVFSPSISRQDACFCYSPRPFPCHKLPRERFSPSAQPGRSPRIGEGRQSTPDESFTGLRHHQMPAPAACLRSHPTLRRDRRSRKRHR